MDWMGLGQTALGGAIAAGIAYGAKRGEAHQQSRNEDQRLATQTAVLEKRFDLLETSIPKDIKSAVDASRAALTESLQNGLGERINKPVFSAIKDFEKRFTDSLRGELMPFVNAIEKINPSVANDLRRDLSATKIPL